MGLGEILTGALVQFGVERAGGAAFDAAKERRAKAVVRRDQWIERYMGKLLRRSAELERKVAALQDKQDTISEALEDPDFWTIFEKAAGSAGRTSDEAKHELLSRIVVERLASAPETTIALAAAQAVDIVPHLSPGHLNLLGVSALVHEIRPEIEEPSYPPPDQEIEDVQAENRRF